MEAYPKTRDELIDDFRTALETSGEDPTTVTSMLRPENLAKLTDDELVSYTERYGSFATKARTLDRDIKKYNNDFAADLKATEEDLDAAGDRIIAEMLAKRKKSGRDNPPA